MSTPTVTEIITPEMRAEILANSERFEVSINKVLSPYKIEFKPGLSLSKMVKESPLYVSKDKAGQTQMFNEVKSLCKAHKVGERLTVEAIIRNYWVRFNGSLADKAGNLKQVNVSLIREDIKASKLDSNLEAAEKTHQLEVENKALRGRVRELEVLSQSSE